MLSLGLDDSAELEENALAPEVPGAGLGHLARRLSRRAAGVMVQKGTLSSMAVLGSRDEEAQDLAFRS